MYWPRDGELEVSLPERHYDLAGRIIARAIAQAEATETPVRATLRAVAHRHGQTAGEARHRSRTDHAAPTETLIDALRDHGYEPDTDGDDIVLHNCPFHALAQEQTELICGMNLAYLEGIVHGLGPATFQPELDPAEGRCCVRISGGTLTRQQRTGR